jgi:hypothetical protein
VRKILRSVSALSAASVLWLVLASGCNATSTEDQACVRLRHLSCECFPNCLADDSGALNSGDARECNDRVRATHAYWSASCENCPVDCEYGWGDCALAVYREVGLDIPYGSCTPGSRECERLRRLSCECLPECQWGDQDTIDSGAADRCDTRVTEYHTYWSAGCENCPVNCEYGWGDCAQQIYIELELPVDSPCPPTASGG